MEGAKDRADKTYKSFLSTAKYWISELDYYGPNQFKQKTDESALTIGQVYDHLINGSYQIHLVHIHHCLAQGHGAKEGKKTFKGKLLFFLGRYPNMNIKGLPEEAYHPTQPESPVKAKDTFYKFMKVMQKTAKEIEASDLGYKTAHPVFGMLNALEWYMLIGMRFRHKLHLKKKLDRTLRSTYKAVSGEEIYSEV